MIIRDKENHIISLTQDRVDFHFYIGERAINKLTDMDRRLMRAIITLKRSVMGVVPAEQLANSLITSLHNQLNRTCHTELVTSVWIDINDVDYPKKYSGERPNKNGTQIDLEIYVDYIIRSEKRKGLLDEDYGFYSPIMLCRFNREYKYFDEISDSMLSCIQLIS